MLPVVVVSCSKNVFGRTREQGGPLAGGERWLSLFYMFEKEILPISGRGDPFHDHPSHSDISTPQALDSASKKDRLQKMSEKSPEEKLRDIEKEIHALVEESAVVREQADLHGALERAKEAGKRERQLCRQRELQNLLDSMNVDLTYAVCLNLAIQHHANGNDNESLTIYTQIVKNKQYPFAGRFRVNMGNVYFEQGKYPSAIKMYRMALDQVRLLCGRRVFICVKKKWRVKNPAMGEEPSGPGRSARPARSECRRPGFYCCQELSGRGPARTRQRKSIYTCGACRGRCESRFLRTLPASSPQFRQKNIDPPGPEQRAVHPTEDIS